MKRSELLQLKKNLDSMDREDLEKTCEILIDALLIPVKFKPKGITKKRDRKRDPNSASERFKENKRVWPDCVSKKYKSAFLHIVGNYVYARTKEFGTGTLIDKPVSHYVWACYTGLMPAKGRRLLHIDKNTKNNEYKNLHPQDGVYQ